MLHSQSSQSVRFQFVVLGLSCLIGLPMLVGCGNSKLADVRGTVTLDGKPLPNAFVKFIPEGEGASSFGKTSEDGTYRMRFSDTENGAFIGSNFVSIGTGDVKADNSGAVPELVPNVYNTRTQLKADVKKGRNTFDFELKSDAGEVEKVEMD